MKKIHYLTIAIACSVLALTGCKRGNKPVTSTSGQPTSSSVTPTSTSSQPTTSSEPVVVDKVLSVSVTPEKASIKPNKTTTLKATVEVEGNASKSVTWKSSDTSVATVSTAGVVTGKKAGTAIITATSEFDTTKQAFATITVVDTGFDPSYLDSGYTYTNEFPIKEVEKFLGQGTYEVIEPYGEIGYGCYYLSYPGDEDYPPQFLVAMKGEITAPYYDKLLSAGWDRVFVDDEFDPHEGEFIDPTLTYTISISDKYDYDDDYNVYYTGETDMAFFRCSDVWGSSTKTTDTEWSEEKLATSAEDWGEASMFDTIKYVPFVALGEDYEINPGSYLFWGIFPVAIPNTLEISDYCLDNTLTEGYDDVLIANGFVYDPLSDVFTKTISENAFVVISYGWTTSGNTIMVQVSPTPLLTYPVTFISEFVSTEIGSFYEIPVMNPTEVEYYTFLVTNTYEYDEDYEIIGTYKSAEVSAVNTTIGDAYAYFDELTLAGFEVDVDDYYLASYGEVEFEAEKGYIYMTGHFYLNETEDGFDDKYGELYYQMYRVDGEETPIEFNIVSYSTTVGDTFQEQAVTYAAGTLTYSSSDENVATVDNDGNVTTHAKGTTEIKATLTTSETAFEASYTLNVKEVATGVTISGPESANKGSTVEFSALPNPEDSLLPADPVWSITSGSEYASIDAETGVLTVNNDITDECSVTIKVTCDTLEASKTITIKAVSIVTDEYLFNSKSWGDETESWTSIKDGAGFNVTSTAGGIQITANASGASCESKSSFSSVSKVVITYATNSSKGVGSIDVSVGDTKISHDITKEGGVTPRELEFDFSSTNPSGKITITVNCSTNSIYVFGASVTHC